MRRTLIALAVAGCTAAPDTGPLPFTDIPLRNPTSPVASQSDATRDRLDGPWVVVAASGLRPGEELTIGADGLTLRGVTFPMRGLGQGRYEIGEDPLWVHWLDADARTAVIGDPNGSRVWVLDRTGAPGERLEAAREILDWYGYDLSRIDGV